MSKETEIQVGDNVVYSNVYGSWSCKVVEVIDEVTYKLKDVWGNIHTAINAPGNTRKDTITKFEKGSAFMVT